MTDYQDRIDIDYLLDAVNLLKHLANSDDEKVLASIEYVDSKFYDAVTQAKTDLDLLSQSLASTYVTPSDLETLSQTIASTYATISALNGKQDTIPSLTLVDSVTDSNANVNVYSDGLYVSIEITGSVASNSSGETIIKKNGSTWYIDSNYRPHTDMIFDIHQNGYTAKLYTTGSVKIYHSTSGSTNLSGQIMYPKISRMPSSS